MENAKRGMKQAISLACGLAMMLPLSMAVLGFGWDGSVSETSNEVYTICVHSLRDAGLVRDSGGVVMAEYDSFALVSLSQDSAKSLSARGLEPMRMEGRTAIMVGGYQFDTRDGEPALPGCLRSAPMAADVPGLFIIQMVGPVKGEWLSEVASIGAKVLVYIPNNAYIVSATSDACEVLRSLPFVQWTGVFHPAYKILSDVTDDSVLVTVQGTATALATVGKILGMGKAHGCDCSVYERNYQVRIDLASHEALFDIARLPDVLWIDRGCDSEGSQQHSETEAEISGGNWTAATPYGGAGSYVNLLGWDGSGVQVSICDGGVGNGATGHPDFQDRYKGGIDYKDGIRNLDGSLATCSSDGLCSHGTHMTGIVGGDTSRGTLQTYHTGYYVGNGVAPNCALASQRLFSEVGDYAFYDTGDTQANWEMFFGDSYYLGTQICACSFGLDAGVYSARSSYFDHAVRDCNVTVSGDQPLSITESVGNSGSSSKVTEPGTSKNVLAVGGTETYYPDATAYSNGGAATSDNPEQLYTGSNAGTNDNRIKPDVVAPCQDTLSTGSQFDGSSYYDGRAYKNGTVDYRYYWNAGTSFSSPNGAGSLAVIYQWFKARYGAYPSPAMAKALILISAKDISGSGSSNDIPNYREGWGRIYLPDAITPAVDILKRDQAANLQTGQTYFLNITCQDTAQPLKIMMAYTDYQAAAGAAKAMVNNLDIRVTAPNSDVYYGNSFTNGRTAVNGYAGNTNFGYDWDDDNNHFDDHNNVEAVYIQSPTAGTYRIEVIGANVVSDAVQATPATDQNFALLAYNVLNGDSDGSPPSFAGVKSAAVTTGSVGSIKVSWDAAQDWSNPISYSLWRFDHAPSEPEINSTSAIWSGTAITFADTGLDVARTYWYVVRARDSLANSEFNAVTASCSAEKLYFFQVQSPSAGYRDLNLGAMEATTQTAATATLSVAGDYKIDTGSNWLSPAFPSATSLDGTWKFNAYGSMNNRYTHGSMYAVVKRYSDSATLFTTSYDDEDVASFTAGYHLFRWQHAASGVSLPAGDRYYVEMWLHVTAIPAAATTSRYDYSSGSNTAYYLDSDDTPPYIINNNPSPTYSQIAYSDDVRSLSRDPSLRNWVSLQCNMFIAETSSQVDEVEMLWEGKGNPADGNNKAPVEDQGHLPFYVWNFATSRWLKVSQRSFNRSTDSVLRCTLTNTTPGFTQWPDYISAGREFRWIAHYKVMDMTMLTDYVNITVRKSRAADGAFTFAYDGEPAPSSVHDPASSGAPSYLPWTNISVTSGWNLISVPLVGPTALPGALQDMANGGAGLVVWDRMMTYTPAMPANLWEQYDTGWAPALNDLTSVNHTIGLWINVTALGDGQICVGGPGYSNSTSASIPLAQGWNLIGYPARDDGAYTAGQLMAATLASVVEGFNSTQTYKTSALAASTVMKRGQAYWVYCPSSTTWWVDW